MWILAVPAILCFFVKLFLTLRIRSALVRNSFSALLIVSLVHSLTEILGVFSIYYWENSEHIFRFYYVVSSWCLGMALIYILDFTKSNLIFRNSIYSAVSLITILFIFTDVIISGYIVKGSVITAIKSPDYWIFSVFAIFCVFCSLGVLAMALMKERALIRRIKAMYLLVGLLVPFAGVVSILALMMAGFNINAVAIIPVLTLPFFIISSESKHGISDIRRFMPWSPESKLTSKVMDIVNQSTLRQKSYQQAKKEINEELFRYYQALMENENKSKILKDYNIPMSTWYSLRERCNEEDK